MKDLEPSGQDMHVVELTTPVLGGNVFRPQSVQTVDAVASEYFPASHAKHAADPAADEYPALQSKQNVELARPSMAENLPPEHLWQIVTLATPSSWE